MIRNVTGSPDSVSVCGDAAGEAAAAGLGDAAGDSAPAGLAAGLAVVSLGVVGAWAPQLTANISTTRRLVIRHHRLCTRTF